MIKKRILYNLENIERAITYIPIVFIIVLYSSLLILSFLIIDAKKNREIEIIKQKTLLKHEFKEKEKLKSFAYGVKSKVNENITGAKSKLQSVVYKSIGYIEGAFLKKGDMSDILSYLEKIEKKRGVNFVLFDSVDFDILRGESIVSHLQYLIFSTKNRKNYRDLVLKYISSQGEDNFQYWIDDIKKTVKVSFFNPLKFKGKVYYIGAFSTMDNLELITKRAIFFLLKKHQSEYIWFYDLKKREVLNFFGKKKRYKADDILKNYKREIKYDILKYYQEHEELNYRFKNRVYQFEKFKFILAVEYCDSDVLQRKKGEIGEIKKEYISIFYKITIFLTIFSLILVIFSFVFLKFVKDVFKRYNKRLELRKESLQRWKKRFELAVIASNDGMWDIDFLKHTIYFSKKWLEISGYKRDEIKNLSDWFALIHKDDRGEVRIKFDEILEGKIDSLVCEYRLRTKNGIYKWILARGKIFYNEKTKHKRMLMMSMDIDKNKRLSKELSNVELLVEDGKIVIFKCKNDEKLSVEFISDSIKSFGYYKNDFERENISFMDLVYKDDKTLLKNAISLNIKMAQKSFSKIFRILDYGGKIRWIYMRVVLLKNDYGEIEYIYGYIHDITRLKRSQEDLKQRVNEEIEKNRQKDSLMVQQNKLASMGEMLGSISHQWRQPLNNVNLILHFLRDNCYNNSLTKDQLADFIKRAKRQIDYMSQTIDDFRNFYKPSKSKNRFRLDLSIESALRIVEEQFKNSDIKIEFFSKNEIFLYNYENEFKQALLNILNNAKDAILQKKESEEFDAYIKIVLKKSGDFVYIEIENNGGNIDDRVMDRIFEPYFTTKFENQGTGIGLYMTKTIIEKNLKGEIGAKNIKEGVKFTIKLPIKDTQ